MREAGSGISCRESETPAQVRLDEHGFGTMRSSGTYIGALLQLERSGDRAAILVDAAKFVGITREEILDYFDRRPCGRCGMADSPLKPCECHEVRPR